MEQMRFGFASGKPTGASISDLVERLVLACVEYPGRKDAPVVTTTQEVDFWELDGELSWDDNTQRWVLS